MGIVMGFPWIDIITWQFCVFVTFFGTFQPGDKRAGHGGLNHLDVVHTLWCIFWGGK